MYNTEHQYNGNIDSVEDFFLHITSIIMDMCGNSTQMDKIKEKVENSCYF